MSKNQGSEVHAFWNCTMCNWVRETVVEFDVGREWLKWSMFEEEHRPQHRCRSQAETGKPFLISLQWFE